MVYYWMYKIFWFILFCLDRGWLLEAETVLAQKIQSVKLLGMDKMFVNGIKSMNFLSEFYYLHGIKHFSEGNF
jgi:hypothetical protein